MLIFADREFNIQTRKNRKGKDLVAGSDFHDAWYTDSFVDVVPLPDDKSRRHVAGYVAGYVLKKLVNKNNTGRVKEFILSSRKSPDGGPGGLGYEYAKIIADRLKHHKIGLPGVDGVEFTKDLHMINIDGKKYPLGRFMREKIYSHLGGDIRPSWVKALSQHQKVIDREEQQDELDQVAKQHANRAKKAYSKYMSNRKL